MVSPPGKTHGLIDGLSTGCQSSEALMPRNTPSDLTSPTARRRLRPLPKSAIYWVTIAEGQHLGYRKAAEDPAPGGLVCT